MTRFVKKSYQLPSRYASNIRRCYVIFIFYASNWTTFLQRFYVSLTLWSSHRISTTATRWHLTKDLIMDSWRDFSVTCLLVKVGMFKFEFFLSCVIFLESCSFSVSFLSLWCLILENAGYEFDYIFDWTIIKYQQAQKNRAQARSHVSMFVACDSIFC